MSEDRESYINYLEETNKRLLAKVAKLSLMNADLEEEVKKIGIAEETPEGDPVFGILKKAYAEIRLLKALKQGE